MFTLLLALYSTLFIFLAGRNFRLALYIFIIALPSYLIRFNIGPLPTTLLEFNFAILFLVWLLKYFRADWPSIKKIFTSHRLFFVLYSLFFVSSVAGIFISDQWYISLGQWRAYFLEPMLFFIILLGRCEQFTPRDIAKALVFSSISIGLLAQIQSYFGVLYPPSLWDDIVAGRATAFFTSPNAVGLYLAPCFLLTMGILFEARKTRPKKSLWFELIAVVIFSGLIASQSFGALIAVALAALLFAIWVGDKRMAVGVAAGIALMTAGIGTVLLVLPQTRNLVTAKIHSGGNRLTLWQYSEEFLTKNPKNFIFGAGIRQFFRKVQKPHYNAKELERLIYPHNFFLNFWSETGLLGLLSVSFMVSWLLYKLYKKIRLEKTPLAVATFCSIIALLIHGLVDVPYFKNDLAFLFWIISALCFSITSTPSPLPRA